MVSASDLFDDSDDPAMDDAPIRALVSLAHSENLWISHHDGECHWLVDGPSRMVLVPYGASAEQWRRALLQAAGACP